MLPSPDNFYSTPGPIKASKEQVEVSFMGGFAAREAKLPGVAGLLGPPVTRLVLLQGYGKTGDGPAAWPAHTKGMRLGGWQWTKPQMSKHPEISSHNPDGVHRTLNPWGTKPETHSTDKIADAAGAYRTSISTRCCAGRPLRILHTALCTFLCA